MGALYIVARDDAAGKTTIGAGLGRYLQSNGKKAGFLSIIPDGNDRDAGFMKETLNLTEAVESLFVADGNTDQVKAAYDRVSQGKDVVIIEGMLNKSSTEIAKALGARLVIVEVYSETLLRHAESYQEAGGNLLGVVINKVPVSRLKQVQGESSAQAEKAGISVLGIIPEDRTLSAVTVGELADNIEGKILNNAEQTDDLVENYMLGAMVVDSGLTYFGRKNNKAAIIRGDRPDMQLAALETATRCLVLTSNKAEPIYNVRQKAESNGIPIILTENDTNAVVANIENALDKARFSQKKKLSRLAGMVPQHLNLEAIAKGVAG